MLQILPKRRLLKLPGGLLLAAGATAAKENGADSIWVLLILIASLFIIITVLRTVRRSLLTIANQKKGLPAPEDLGFWKETVKWIKTHKVHFAVINIFLTAVFCVYGWQYLWGIDVTPGYHPSQPINFRHDVHAGTNGVHVSIATPALKKEK